MPQATDNMRALMTARFGSIDCGPIVAHLHSRGYTLTDDWQWIAPAPAAVLAPEDLDAIEFLITEWDFGGIRDSR